MGKMHEEVESRRGGEGKEDTEKKKVKEGKREKSGAGKE